MVVRAIALSLALLIGGMVLIPLATDQAEAGPRTKKSKKRGWKGVKKYSKRWWQLYRAQERRKKLRAKNRRFLRLRQLRLAQVRTAQNYTPVAKTKTSSATPTASGSTAPAILPSGDAAPAGWSPALTSPAELQFRVDNSAGDQVGSASTIDCRVNEIASRTNGRERRRRPTGIVRLRGAGREGECRGRNSR